MAVVSVELTGDEAKLLRSMQRVIDAQAKLGQGFKKVKKEASEIEQAFAAMQKNIEGIATSYFSISTASGLITEALQQQAQLQKESLDRAEALAKKQQEAAKNLAGSSNAQVSDLLRNQVPAIARRSNFSDLGAITESLGSVASIIGDELAPAIVEISASVNKLTPEGLRETSTALADLVKAAHIKDPQQAISLILSTGAVARPEQLNALVGGAVTAVNSGIMAAPKQDAIEATKDSLALYAVLTKLDPRGQSAATNQATFAAQLAEFFGSIKLTDTEDVRRRQLLDKKEITRKEELEIQDAELDLADKQRGAKRFGEGKRPEAVRARLEVEQAIERLKQTKEESTLNQYETEELSTLDKKNTAFQGVSDPGTTLDRIKVLQDNEELQKLYVKDMKGEEKFKPLMKSLLDKNSVDTKELNSARESINDDPATYQKFLEKFDLTEEQKIANRGAEFTTSKEILKTQDRERQARAEINRITSDALSETRMGYTRAIERPFDQLMQFADSVFYPVDNFAKSSQSRLIDRREYTETLPESQTKQNELALLQSAIDQLASIMKEFKEGQVQQTEVIQEAIGDKNKGPTYRNTAPSPGAFGP